MKTQMLSVVLISLVLLGCSSDPPGLRLLPASAQKEDQDAETERLRQMQLVTVEHEPGSAWCPGMEPCTTQFTPASVSLNLNDSCREEVGEPWFGSSLPPSSFINTCELNLFEARVRLCQAHKLLEAATIRSQPVFVDFDFQNVHYKIYAQSTATNAALARLALNHAAHSVEFAAETLGDARVASGPTPWGSACHTSVSAQSIDLDDTGPAPAESAGVQLARVLVEGANLYREATETGTRNILATADMQLGSPSRAEALQHGISAAQLSRAEAARRWVGGGTNLYDPSVTCSLPSECASGICTNGACAVSHGLPGFVAGRQHIPALPVGGFCTEPELTAQAQAAMSVLREAAVSPVAILDEPASGVSGTTIRELLDDTGTSVAGGSVRQRLADYWGPLLTTDDLEEQFGLSEADFLRARRYLGQEILAFSRSISSSASRDKFDGTTSSYVAYGATASRPTTRNSAYYAALARYNTSQRNSFSNIQALPTLTLTTAEEPPSYADLMDYVTAHAAEVLENIGSYNATITPAIKPVIGMLTNGGTTLGRLSFCVADSPSAIAVQGFSASDGLVIVEGEDGLSCAVDNNIEGQDCNLTPLVVGRLLNDTSPAGGFASAVSGVVENIPRDVRLYLVKPHAGVPAISAPDPAEGLRPPGSYEALVGVTIPSGIALPFCTEAPIVPEAERKAAAALAPSEDSCGHSKVSCAGTEFDERMPLEDELTDDNDGVESSWRRYLALAREAADEADLLGEQYILSGLEADRRDEDLSLRDEQKRQLVESHLEELQTICGTAIDTSRLFKFLTGQNGEELAGYAPDDCPCDPGFKCMMGTCIVDLPAKVAALGNDAGHPDMLRLAECLDPGSATPFVHLGEDKTDGGKGVCVWRGTGTTANELCALPAGDCDPTQIGVQPCLRADHPCPVLASSAESDCSAELGFGDLTPSQLIALGVDAQRVDDGLGYFPLDLAVTPVAGNVCETIRRARAGTGVDFEGLAALIESNVLHPLRTTQAAHRIGFEGRAGGFAAITVDGFAEHNTGSPWTGVATGKWPCGANAAFSDCTTGAGLFCGNIDCENSNTRAQMNARFLRAVIATRILTETFVRDDPNLGTDRRDDPKGIWLPYYSAVGGGSTRDLHEGTPILTGKGEVGSEFGVGATVTYHSLGPFPIPLYYDENGGLPFGTTTTGIQFVEMGLPRPPELDFNSGALMMLGLSRGNRPPPPVLSGSGYLVQDFLQSYLRDILVGGRGLERALNASFELPLSLDERACSNPRLYRPVYGPPSADCAFETETIGSFNFNANDFLDGLELLCEVSREQTECDLAAPPSIDNVGDLPKAHRFLECAANSIRGRGALSVFANLPNRAVDALRKESVVGAFPAVGGELGNAVSNIRTGLVTVASVSPLVATELEELGRDLDTLHVLLTRSSIREGIADIQYMAQTVDRLAACATPNVPTLMIANISTCANAASQIQFASQINSLVAQDEQLARELEIADFTAKFANRSMTLQGYALDLVTAMENVDGGLITFEGLKQAAQRAVLGALYAASFHAKNEIEITSVLRQRLETGRVRYEQAHQNAVRMAFLAKRAIEQRLGVHLSELTEELPLVAAPSTWESSLCSTTGVDYKALREISDAAPKDFADAYIGDYVTKLENVVESYRLEFGFHEGADVAVISLRDDVQNVRAECLIDSENLLYHAGQFDAAAAQTAEMSVGWRAEGCRTDVGGTPLPDCIASEARSEAAFAAGLPSASSAFAYDITFGEDGSYCSGTDVCGFQDGAELQQTVELAPGTYRFSWYEIPGPMGPGTGPWWFVRGSAGSLSTTVTGFVPPQGATWPRPYVTFDLPAGGPVTVGFKQPIPGVASISIAAPMLERVEDKVSDLVPGIFVNTDSTLTTLLPLCEDTNGEVFRSTAWERQCVKLCKDGFSAQCDAAASETHCYRQTKFSINQRAIESGNMLKSAGFARGNFNYRIDTIAANFVGTGTRDCENSPTPSSCFGGGFIPYSLEHRGPYYVRNHWGRDFKAELFTGNIEHARGLASERYLSNPVSSADRELLTDYVRKELRGRPLDGNFVLRVWEEPGVNFDGIEDVQIILNYRYWTRFN